MQILHSKILGEGNPLLILHGYFGMGDNWKTLGNAFAEQFEVHLIDQRNHGRSFHASEFNYNVMAADLRSYIQHHNLQSVYLLGHSMGGKTAMLFATEDADLVDKLVIADISPRAYKPHHNEILAALNSVDFSIHNTRKLVDEQLQKYIPEFGVRQFLLKNVYWKEKGILDFRFHLKALTKNNSEVGKGLPAHSKYEKPTLFLSGGNSGYITDQDALLIQSHFPNSRVKTIADTGHWLHAEKPEEFFTLVNQFLQNDRVGD